MNVALGLVLIRRGAQEHGLGKQERNIVLEQSHIIRVALKPMYHHKQVNASIVVLGRARLCHLFLAYLIERLNVALFKEHRLEILNFLHQLRLIALVRPPDFF